MLGAVLRALPSAGQGFCSVWDALWSHKPAVCSHTQGGRATAWLEAEIFHPFLLGGSALLVHTPLIFRLAGN